jgi:hypothetical protein
MGRTHAKSGCAPVRHSSGTFLEHARLYVYCMTRSAPVTPDQPTQTTTAHAARGETGAPQREPRVIPLVLAAGVLITAAWLVFLAWMVLAVIL